MYFITTKRMLEVCFSAHPNIQYRTRILRDSLGCLFFCRSHRSIGATIQLILLPL